MGTVEPTLSLSLSLPSPLPLPLPLPGASELVLNPDTPLAFVSADEAKHMSIFRDVLAITVGVCGDQSPYSLTLNSLSSFSFTCTGMAMGRHCKSPRRD